MPTDQDRNIEGLHPVTSNRPATIGTPSPRPNAFSRLLPSISNGVGDGLLGFLVELDRDVDGLGVELLERVAERPDGAGRLHLRPNKKLFCCRDRLLKGM